MGHPTNQFVNGDLLSTPLICSQQIDKSRPSFHLPLKLRFNIGYYSHYLVNTASITTESNLLDENCILLHRSLSNSLHRDGFIFMGIIHLSPWCWYVKEIWREGHQNQTIFLVLAFLLLLLLWCSSDVNGSENPISSLDKVDFIFFGPFWCWWYGHGVLAV